MPVLYSLRTAERLMRATPRPKRPRVYYELTPPWDPHDHLPHTIAHDWDTMSPDERQIWRLASVLPDYRFNYIGAATEPFLQALGAGFNPSHITWTELDSLGRLLLMAGFMSLLDYTSLVLVSRVEESLPPVQLRLRRPDAPFDALMLWHLRLAGLEKVYKTEFEATRHVVKVLQFVQDNRRRLIESAF